MIVQASINAWDGKWAKLTDEQYAALRAALPHLPEVREERPPYESFITDERGVRALAAAKLSVDLEPGAENTMLVKLQDRIAVLEHGVDRLNMAELAAAGAVVQVHVPDLPLMLIDEVDYMDDACTVELQSRLNDGWRILAVCPPNAQRRPDYILGRRKQR